MNHRQILLIFAILFLLCGVVAFSVHTRIYQPTPNWEMLIPALPRIGDICFGISLFFAVIWSLFAPSKNYFYIFGSFLVITAIFFSAHFFVQIRPFHPRMLEIGLSILSFMIYPILLGVAASYTHFCLSRKITYKAEQGAAANP